MHSGGLCSRKPPNAHSLSRYGAKKNTTIKKKANYETSKKTQNKKI